jgi:CBS domain-containing protein
MLVREIMTADPICCTPDTNLGEVAKLMANNDCGALPVVENERSRKPVGIITDRDIVCRIVAADHNPLQARARDAMSAHLITVRPDMEAEECFNLMEEKQVRRVPVVDNSGACCGIVAQADVAIKASGEETAELVKDVSKPTGAPSHSN